MREYISTKPKYKSKYYDGGYSVDEYGVCTDVVANGLLGAGYDLRELVNNDIEKSFVSIDEKFAEVIKKLDSFDITEQVNSINSKILNISEEINLIPSKISFASLESLASVYLYAAAGSPSTEPKLPCPSTNGKLIEKS